MMNMKEEDYILNKEIIIIWIELFQFKDIMMKLKEIIIEYYKIKYYIKII